MKHAASTAEQTAQLARRDDKGFRAKIVNEISIALWRGSECDHVNYQNASAA